VIDPIKIWTRIERAFIDVEVENIAVRTLTLPQRYLDIIIKQPTVLKENWSIPERLYFVENPCCPRCRRISGARIEIGKSIRAN
jgi:hypothetical protein